MCWLLRAEGEPINAPQAHHLGGCRAGGDERSESSPAGGAAPQEGGGGSETTASRAHARVISIVSSCF